MSETIQKFFSRKFISILLGSTLLFVLAALIFIQKSNKDTILINTNDKSPIDVIGGSGERIYLKFGAIYARNDDPAKEYNIVNGVFHVTSERYKQLVFFDTPKEAEAAGYKPSENFAKDYACFKEGKNFLECDDTKWEYGE